MSKRFADNARQLAGAAGRSLGWPPHWFWSATPAELAAILHDENGTAATGMDRAQLEALMEREGDG